MPDLTLNLTDAIGLARKKFDRGEFGEVENICRQILAIAPENIATMQLLGIAQVKLGRKIEALETIELALQLGPVLPEAHLNKALLLSELGRSKDALVSANAALVIRPEYFEALQQKGVLLRALKRHEEAASAFEAALGIRSGDFSTVSNLFNTYVDLDRREQAYSMARLATELQPESPSSHYNLGNALLALDKNEEALAAFDKAIALAPEFANAHYNRGIALKTLKRPDEALDSYDRAIAAKSDYYEAYTNKGYHFVEMGRVEDALREFDRALAVNPKSAEAHYNKGTALFALSQFHEAVASYNRAIECDSNFASAHWNLAIDLLRLGDFEQGWREYELRKKKSNWIQHDLMGPEWQGEIAPGKTLLLYCEQGLGDAIQFARFAAMIAERGMKVILLCPGQLLRLLRGKPHPNLAIEHVLPGLRYDTHAPLMSVPFLTGIHPPHVLPANPCYLAADDSLVRIWRERLPAHGLRIGVAWQGNPDGKVDVGRSYPLRALARVAAKSEVTLISLQKNYGLDQLENLPPDFKIITLGEFDNGPGAFLDTAAIMMNLDLIITSDTSIAHLAGALGRPVWVALKHAPDWRWGLDGETTPWYPTMRLFRQKSRGDWDSAIENMETALNDLIRNKHQPAGSALVPIAFGELIDKITILEIKSERIADPQKNANVRIELDALNNALSQFQNLPAGFAELKNELRRINEALWEIEDHIRDRERDKDFGPTFVALARSVYVMNDQRAATKRKLNEIVGSVIVEEKSYSDYS